jgi:hypothetical protein
MGKPSALAGEVLSITQADRAGMYQCNYMLYGREWEVHLKAVDEIQAYQACVDLIKQRKVTWRQ